MDIEKLIKVLGMTTSAHDGEALAALRTALKMMAAAKVTWADIIVVKQAPTMTHQNDASKYRPAQQSDFAHAEMFRRMYEQMRAQQTRQQSKAYKATEDHYSDELFEIIFGVKRKK